MLWEIANASTYFPEPKTNFPLLLPNKKPSTTKPFDKLLGQLHQAASGSCPASFRNLTSDALHFTFSKQTKFFQWTDKIFSMAGEEFFSRWKGFFQYEKGEF